MILDKKFLIILLTLTAAYYFYSLIGRPPDIDDAWIGEHAYFLAKDGYVHSELMRGVTSQEDYLIVHHKLLNLQGALFIRIFGFSLYSLKAVSLFYFLVFLACFYVYTRKQSTILSQREWILAITLIFSFPWIFKYSFTFRPEIIVMTLGFISFILLDNQHIIKHRVYLSTLLAGLVSGLCFAFHLNGITVAMAGFLLLILTKRYREAFVFSLGSLVTASVYFYDFNSTYGIDYWFYQLTASPAMDSLTGVPVVLKPFVNFAREHMRYFHNAEIIIFSLLLIFAIITGLKNFIRENRTMSIYLGLLFVLVAMTAVHKSRQYILIYFPYLVILIVKTLETVIYDREKLPVYLKKISLKTLKWISLLLFLAFIAGSFYFNYDEALKKFSPEENKKMTEEYIQGNPDTLNIIAPMTFIFNEIEYFNRIQAEVCYTELMKADTTIQGAGFLEKAKTFDIDYIILSDYYRKMLKMSDLQINDSINGFVVLRDDDEHSILKKMGY